VAIKGDLSAVGLADVFQMLAMSQRVGTLVVQDKESRKCIFFSGNSVRLLSLGPRKGLRLGDMLVRAGRITREQLEECLAAQKETSRRLGEILVERGLATEEEVRAFVKRQIEEEIYDLFLWQRATFEFIEGDPPPELASDDATVQSLVFDVNGLLMEACRRVDEWGRIHQAIPSSDAVFRWADEGAREAARSAQEPVVRLLAEALDGASTVRDLCDQSVEGNFAVCSAMREWVEAGRIQEVPPAEVVQKARALRAAGERDRAIRLMRAAVNRSGESADPAWLKELADWLIEDDRAEGGTIFVRVADLHRAEGRDEQLAIALERAIRARPDDLRLRSELFDVLERLGRREQAAEHGGALVEAMIRAGDADGAVALANRMRRLDTRSRAGRVWLLRALHAKGESRTAAEELRLLLRDLKPWEAEDQQIEREMRERFPDFFRALTEGALPPVRRRSPLPLWLAVTAGVLLVAAVATAFVLGRSGPGAGGDSPGGGGSGTRPANGDHTPPPEDLDAVARRIARALDEGDWQEAEAGLNILRDRVRSGATRFAADVAKFEQRLQREREAERILDEARARLAEGDAAAAAAAVRRVVFEFGGTRAATGARVPLRIETEPPGARVSLNGVDVEGATPLVVHLPPLGAARLVLRRDGFADENVVLGDQDRFDGVRWVRLGRRVQARGWPILEGGSEAALAGDVLLIPSEFAVSLRRLSAEGPLSEGSVGVRSAVGRWIAAVGDVIVLNEGRRGLAGIRAEDGRWTVAWRRELEGAVRGPVAASGEQVVCVAGGEMRTFRADSGEPVAAPVRLPAEVIWGPYCAAGLVVVQLQDHVLAAWEAGSSALKWTQPLEGPLAEGSVPAGGGGWLVIGLQGGKVVALDAATGGVLWATGRLGGSIRGGVEVLEEIVYVAATDGKLYMIAGGAPRERVDLGGDPVGRPVAADGRIVVCCVRRGGGADVKGFEHRTLAPVWTFEMREDRVVGSPIVASRWIVVPAERQVTAVTRE
jgi:tetratricopeptide (TPR) repeat protein